MQKYLLASLKIINDTTCYLYPQFEYDDDGKLHVIENKKYEFPDRGTIFLPKKANEDLNAYLNKLIKIQFDSENIAPNYNAYDTFSNMCKYFAKTSDIESLARDELVEIIEIRDKTIEEILRDKQARFLTLNDLPLNNAFLLQMSDYCYGPFKYIPCEEVGTKIKIKIVPDDDKVSKYNVSDLEAYRFEAQVTSNSSDPKRHFIRSLEVLNSKVRIVETLESIDDETLIQELQKILSESKSLTNVNVNAFNVLRDMKNLLEAHPEIQSSHPVLTPERMERVSGLLSKFDGLDDYKQQIIEEYFRLGKVSEEEKLAFLQEHPEFLEDVIAKTTDYESRLSDLQSNLQRETERLEELQLQKESLNEEIQELKDNEEGYRNNILSSARSELAVIQENVRELEREKSRIDGEISLAKNLKKDLIRQSTDLDIDIENKILEWLATKRDNDIIGLLVSEFGKYKQPEEEKIEEYNIVEYENGEAIISRIMDFFEKAGRTLERNDIINYLITVSGNFMTVFAGQPGTGKTSTCTLLSKALGIYTNRYAPISVGRGWTSSRDLMGYYNSLTQTFEQTQPKFTKCLETLTKEANTGLRDALYVVMLDEANLSQIEHYWADFIQISDDYKNAVILVGNSKEYKLTEELRFLATINYDHTTEVLSPRFLDRAWIVRMEYKEGDNLLTNLFPNEEIANEESVVSFNDLKEYFSVHGQAFKGKQVSSYCKEILGTLMEQFAKEGCAISPRSISAMIRYCIIAETYMDDKQSAVDYAVAQKLLPQINGSGKQYLEFLEGISATCKYLVKSSNILRRIIDTGKKEHNYFNFFNI